MDTLSFWITSILRSLSDYPMLFSGKAVMIGVFPHEPKKVGRHEARSRRDPFRTGSPAYHVAVAGKSPS
jgi:hypothetical protein